MRCFIFFSLCLAISTKSLAQEVDQAELIKSLQQLFSEQPDSTSDLGSLIDSYAQQIDQLSQSTQVQQQETFDRYNDLRYNPHEMLAYYDSMLAMYGDWLWLTEDHIALFEQIKEKENLEGLSLARSADLAYQYWANAYPNRARASDPSKLKADFIQSMKSYERIMYQMYPHVRQYQQMSQAQGGTGSIVDYPFDTYIDFWPMARNLPALQRCADELRRVEGLRDIRDISEERFESNQLEEMAKYRGISLRLYLKAIQNQWYDPFGEEMGAVGFNSILASKGAGYRAKRFLLEGVRQSPDPGLKAQYATLRAKKQQLGEVHLMPDTLWQKAGWSDSLVEAEVRAVAELQRSIYRQITQQKDFVAFANQWSFSWQGIQQSLPENEAFVDIERINVRDTITYLFTVIKPDQHPVIITLDSAWHPDRKGNYTLEQHYAAYRNQIDEYYEPAYEVFWRVIDEQLHGVERLYLSADGIYHLLSVAGLKKDTDQFVGDELEIVRLMDISEIKNHVGSEGQPDTPDSYLLIGHPDYNNGTPQKEGIRSQDRGAKMYYARRPLSELENTVVEVEAIADIVSSSGRQVAVWQDGAATEGRFRKIASPAVLHVATHGTYQSPPEDTGQLSQAKLRQIENPLLRNYLYLAGANLTRAGKIPEGPDDGIVNGEDIAHLDLSGTELVVLSACQTGLGEVAEGEGAFSLYRSFRLAGAQGVIATLWFVDDEATQRMMVTFYENMIQKNMPIRAAFLAARQSLRQHPDYSHPYFWAPFILVGQ